MRFLGLMAKVIGKIWVFATRTITISIIAFFVLFVFAILMPENVEKAIGIVKGLL